MTEPLRILMLEDNPADAELIQFELQESGLVFTSKVVMTEEDFVHGLQGFSPDLILSDYDLPKYNGALALAEAKRRRPDTSFILVTGAVTEDRAIDILTQGAKDYVLKTRLQQRLVPAVKRALAEAQEHRARKEAESELREAHRTLEERVKIRTAELEAAMAARKKTDAALQDSEKRYRRLFETSKDGVLILDADTGKVVDVNPFLSQLLGYSYDELCGKHIWEIGEFKDIAASKDAFKALQDHEYVHYDDLPLETRNGQSIAVEFASNVYLVDHTKVVQCNIRDITENKRMEKTLRASEERYRVLFEAMNEGFAIHEIITDEQNTPVDYCFLDINPAFERLTGLKREDVVGKTHNEVLPGDDPKWLHMYGAVALTGKPVQFENYSPALKRHYKVLAYRSAPRQFAVIFMDITERRHNDEAIQIMLQRFHSLVSNIRSSILLVGEGGIELANQAFCEYFGLPDAPPDLIGLTTGQLIEKIKSAYLHPEEEVTRIREIIDLGQPVIGEEIAMRCGKTCLRDFIPIGINGKLYGRLWNHTDITKRKRAENQRNSEKPINKKINDTRMRKIT